MRSLTVIGVCAVLGSACGGFTDTSHLEGYCFNPGTERYELCSPDAEVDAGVWPDAMADAGPADIGEPDTGVWPDATAEDAGRVDMGMVDSGEHPDAAPVDMGQPDTGVWPDAAPMDVGFPDSGVHLDATPIDAGGLDTGLPPDAGQVNVTVTVTGPGQVTYQNAIIGLWICPNAQDGSTCALAFPYGANAQFNAGTTTGVFSGWGGFCAPTMTNPTCEMFGIVRDLSISAAFQ